MKMLDGIQYTTLNNIPIIITGTPKTAIISGIHGNEKSGPIACINHIKQKPIPNSLTIPIINPKGYTSHTRTKEGKDLNRDYPNPTEPETKLLETLIKTHDLNLLISIHEDDTHTGTYIYTNSKHLTPTCKEILTQTKDIIKPETKESIFGDANDNGLIIINKDNKKPKNINSLEYHSKLPYICIEVPESAPLEDRLKVLQIALNKIHDITTKPTDPANHTKR